MAATASINPQKDPFSSPNANKSLPPTPHSRSQSLLSYQTPLHLRAETPFDPFLDPASPPSTSRNETPLHRLPHEGPRVGGLPREETFQSTTESLAGITASAGSVSEYETEYGYTEPDLYAIERGREFKRRELNYTENDLHGASMGYSQRDLHFTEGDLHSTSQGYTQEHLHDASQSYTENNLHGVSHGFSQPHLDFSDVDLHTPSQELGQAELGAAEDFLHQDVIEAPPVLRPIRVIAEDVSLPLPPQQPKTSWEKSTLQGTSRSQSTLASVNPFSDPPRGKLSSPATDITTIRALQKAPYTPSALGTHPALRQLAGGYNSQGNSSTTSLNREVRLREAAKHQDALLRLERAQDDNTRTPLHAVPTLRPSPVALKVAAQLIRDSPAGKLPIGPQAVLHSKCFWTGGGIAQVGLVSMTAAITKIVHDGDIYQNSPDVGTENIFWLTISIVALLGGGILTAIAFMRKMGYWVDKQQLLGLDEIGLVDRLLRRDRTPRAEAELGTLPGSVQTFASDTTTPRPREGLYVTQGRFNYETFNSLNPEWQELYMTPEQLRKHISHQNINSLASTPSKPGGTRDANGLLSSGPSLEDFNQTSPEPLQPASIHFTHPSGTPFPFQRFPESLTPFIPASTNFQHSSPEGNSMNSHNTTRESVRVEVDNWSPLENLTRDINSEHVRNMPIELRHGYITGQRLRSEDRTRKIRESLERGSIRSGSRRNSDGASTRPANITEIAEEKRGRMRGPTTPFRRVPEAQRAVVVGEDGVEVELEMVDFATTGMSSSRKIEGDGGGDERESVHRRRASGGSVEKMKKMLGKGKTGFRELDGRNVGKGVREKIERLREQSERAQVQGMK